MWSAAKALLARDLRLLWRRRGDALQPAMFALLVVVLFALALGGEAPALSKVASAVLWMAVLLAGLLALDTLFRGDAEDGSLEQWMLAPVPLSWLVLVRTFTHWATTALPLLVATPFLAELLHLPRSELPVLLASLALGTPLLSLLGAVVELAGRTNATTISLPVMMRYGYSVRHTTGVIAASGTITQLIPQGSQLNIAVPQDDWKDNLELVGEAVWVKPVGDDKGYWVGLELRDSNRDAMQKWFKVVHSLSSTPPNH